jgi:predicted nuclease of predicted toxin-antitoxin system
MSCPVDELQDLLAVRRGQGLDKDADFHERSFLWGHPPKGIWIRRGNCSTDDVAVVLRVHHADLLAFERDAESSFLALG